MPEWANALLRMDDSRKQSAHIVQHVDGVALLVLAHPVLHTSCTDKVLRMLVAEKLEGYCFPFDPKTAIALRARIVATAEHP